MHPSAVASRFSPRRGLPCGTYFVRTRRDKQKGKWFLRFRFVSFRFFALRRVLRNQDGTLDGMAGVH